MHDKANLAKTLMDSEPAPKPKAKKRASAKPTTIDGLCAAYIDALTTRGKSSGTARTYAADLAVAKKHFGTECDPKTLTPDQVATFFDTDLVTKGRDGNDKNPITVAKIRRVFRLMLVWAAETKLLKEAPLPVAEAAPKNPKQAPKAPAKTAKTGAKPATDEVAEA